MDSRIKYLIKGLLFVVIFGICFKFVNILLTPKYFYTNEWPTTATYAGFYQMDRNTVDVIFLGSSHAVSAFSPQQLYDEYNITSYNLGCEQQNMLTSYFWLKEALRFQTPKVVVLDTYLLFEQQGVGPLNSIEGCTRKAFDFMKWSPVKIAAINKICEIDTSQNKLSYYFPNIRYHTRWDKLEEEDYNSLKMFTKYELKGYSRILEESGINTYSPFEVEEDGAKVEMLSTMEQGLIEIIELCEDKGIELVLVKTPCIYESPEKYYATNEIANNYDIPFYDFNVKMLYNDLNFEFAKDTLDEGHANENGAIKLTSYIGKVLVDEYDLTQHVDMQWEIDNIN